MGIPHAQLQNGLGLHCRAWQWGAEYRDLLRAAGSDESDCQSAGGVCAVAVQAAEHVQDSAVLHGDDGVSGGGDDDSVIFAAEEIVATQYVLGAGAAGGGQRVFDFSAEGLFRFAAAGAL